MISTLKKLLVPIAILVVLGFILFMVNQVSGIYLMVSDLNPLLGRITLVILGVGIAFLFISPVLIYFRIPAPLKRPTTQMEVEDYQKKLVKRLSGNRILKENKAIPKSTEDLPQAIGRLNENSDRVILETASIVFLTTSISQNGKLDALTVFWTQVRMIWKIAHVYYQRPTIRELLFLYAHVGTNSFLASQIEDLDISRQIEPVASAIFKNASGKSVPFFGPGAQIILDSLLEGSTNAFLTLRVGIMSKRYCGELGVIQRDQLKKEVLKESAIKLKTVTLKSSGQIISAIVKASSNAGLDTIKSGWEGIRKAGTKVKEGISNTSQKMNPFPKKKTMTPD